jgi:glycosyltransferase A (GT-A) superfamily protein (DUF2064 family)
MAFELLAHSYLLAAPAIGEGGAARVIDEALARAREKHPDFVRFEPAIEFLSTVFFTDHARMPIDDYLETLYCAVKHGDFSKTWRLLLKKPASDAVQ